MPSAMVVIANSRPVDRPLIVIVPSARPLSSKIIGPVSVIPSGVVEDSMVDVKRGAAARLPLRDFGCLGDRVQRPATTAASS